MVMLRIEKIQAASEKLKMIISALDIFDGDISDYGVEIFTIDGDDDLLKGLYRNAEKIVSIPPTSAFELKTMNGYDLFVNPATELTMAFGEASAVSASRNGWIDITSYPTPEGLMELAECTNIITT